MTVLLSNLPNDTSISPSNRSVLFLTVKRMALRRYTGSVDGTIPVQALLYNDEELLGSQDGVGIYDG